MHRRLSQTFQLRIASSVTFLTFKTLVFDILHSTLPLFATRHCGCFRPCLPKQATIRLWTTASFRWKLYPKIMFKCTAHTHTHSPQVSGGFVSKLLSEAVSTVRRVRLPSCARVHWIEHLINTPFTASGSTKTLRTRMRLVAHENIKNYEFSFAFPTCGWQKQSFRL